MKGEAIEQESNIYKYYGVSFEEVHLLEDSGECNYGDSAEFKTFADCVAYEKNRSLNQS